MSPTIASRRSSFRRGTSWSGLAAWLALLGCFACAPAKPEPIDAANLSGRWTLDTGAETEWFQLVAGGTFTAEIRQDGFIPSTLSQGPRVEASGAWNLAGRTLTFTIDASNDAALVGAVHAYEIQQLTDEEMVTTDARGKQARLRR